MTIDFPILYINLDRSTDRREKMEKQFAELGVKAIRIPGVDGVRDEGKPDYPKVSKFWSWVFNGRQLTKGEIGCAASQIRAAKYIVENKLDWALVLEDDIELSTSKLAEVPAIASQATNFDTVSVVTSLPRGEIYNMQVHGQSTRIFRIVGRRNTAMAVIVNRSGAEKLSRIGTIQVPADVYNLLEAVHGVVGAFVWPNLIPLPPPAEMNSKSIIDRVDQEAAGDPGQRYGSNSIWKFFVRPIVLGWSRRVMRNAHSNLSGLCLMEGYRLQ